MYIYPVWTQDSRSVACERCENPSIQTTTWSWLWLFALTVIVVWWLYNCLHCQQSILDLTVVQYLASIASQLVLLSCHQVAHETKLGGRRHLREELCLIKQAQMLWLEDLIEVGWLKVSSQRGGVAVKADPYVSTFKSTDCLPLMRQPTHFQQTRSSAVLMGKAPRNPN